MRALSLAVLTFAVPAFAWDTWISTRHNWGSVYSSKFGGTGSYVAPYLDPKGNEHAEISDHVLRTLDPKAHQLFGVHADPNCTLNPCPQYPVIVDLNASFIRPELFGVDDLGNTQNPPTVLEERKFPRLAMWAGLPDFNYTVYDWINKSTRCPSLPHTADKYELCHVYRAWLGAGLNSTHMGELNDKVYARIHATAVKQGERAGQLRKLFEEGGRSKQMPKEGATWYADYTREAELMALTYEQVGQHFLHDRWAIGHMFSRWGPGSYEELNQGITKGKVSLDRVSSYGTLTGIVHGSIAVFGKPDPLGAPAIDYSFLVNTPDTAKAMSFRYSRPNAVYSDPEQTTFTGLGDYFYKDIVDESFDGTVLHPKVQGIRVLKPPLVVKPGHQRKGLLTCGANGLREVVEKFAIIDGGHGEFGLDLPPLDPNVTLPMPSDGGALSPTSPACNDLWATNDSYYASARTIAGPTWLLGDGVINDIAVAIGTAIEGEDHVVLPPSVRMEHGVPAIIPYTPPIRRVVIPLSRVIWRSWVNKKHDENAAGNKLVKYGTDSAKTGIGFSDNGINYRPNGQFAVPKYYEPEDLDTLPWFSEVRMSGKIPSGGRDKAAIDGFFNKARTETWCKMMYGLERNEKKAAVTLKLLREKGLEYEIDGRRSIPTGPANAKRARAMCSYLANRAYKRTDQTYPQLNSTRTEVIGEYLPLTGGGAKYGPTYEPVCAYFHPDIDIVTGDAKDDDKPYQLKPGYVATPGEVGAWGYAPKSLENWCSLIPVLEVGMIQDEPDAVGEILHDDGDRWLELKGENVGMRTPSKAVGKIVAFDKDGLPRTLDVWDPDAKKETGGWSVDNLVVWGRIPGSLNGFPSFATAALPVQNLKNVAPKPYTLELTRPDDVQASYYFRANGAKTVGTYKFLLHPSWVESANFSAASGQKRKGIWVTYPEWSRPQTTVLKEGLFRVDAMGNYTEVTAAELATAGVGIEYREGQYPMFDAQGSLTWIPDKNRVGWVYSHPTELPQGIFATGTSFFFAFH